ncbi:tetratricopeptide repeat protein [Planotetraspora sp. GP83]|uniref:tetratricopeptide repeat protein n=1 Tax=Planotetraspora sp. GP83 TaxID=3156264 RepID=UPI00351838F1
MVPPFPDVAGHGAHVLKQCGEGRFVWAHAYVDRLVTERPGDPHPLLLRALIYAYRGEEDSCRKALAEADALGAGHPELRSYIGDLSAARTPPAEAPVEKITLKDAGGCLLGLVVLGVLFRGPWLMETCGDWLASQLGIRGRTMYDGHSIPGFVMVAALVGLARLGWWAVKTRRGTGSLRAEIAGRRARARRVAADLDDDNLRNRAGGVAMLLPFSVFFAAVPAIMTSGPIRGWLVAAWTIVMSLGLIAGAAAWAGRRPVVRAVGLSRLLLFQVIATYGVIGTFSWALITGVSEDALNTAGMYWFGSALVSFVSTAIYLFTVQRRLRREGRLQHWPEKRRRAH